MKNIYGEEVPWWRPWVCDGYWYWISTILIGMLISGLIVLVVLVAR